MTDYFKNKIPLLSLSRKKDESSETSENECERYVGFGFSQSSTQSNVESKKPIVSPEVTPKKRKSEVNIENTDKATPKKRKIHAHVFENPGLDLMTTESPSRCAKNKMEVIRSPSIVPIECIPSEDQDSFSSPKKVKKNRKKIVSPCGFTNDALNLEGINSETPSAFKITRPDASGLANDALDLTDETNGKKRVTFNDTVEYNTDSAKKKKKSRAKLDKFEVSICDKKKKKKSKKIILSETEANSFFNQALDVEVINEEIIDNEVNEKKSKKSKKRRNKRELNLETIAEAPEDDKENDNVEVITLDDSFVGNASQDLQDMSLATPKKKKKTKHNIKEENLESNNDEKIEIVCIDENTKKKKIKNNKIKIEPMEVEIKIEDDSQVVNLNDHVKLTSADKKDEKKIKYNKIKIEPMEVKIKIKDDAQVVNLNDEKKIKIEPMEVEIKIEDDAQVVDLNDELKLNSADKKEKKKKIKKIEKIEDDDSDSLENLNSPNFVREKKRKSKKLLKSLFMKNPVVQFVGSNLHEIPGYGVNL